MMDIDFSKPDAVNDKGTKWWVDKELTKYAGHKGLELAVFIIECLDGRRTRLVSDKKGNIIYENTSLESVACWIDILAVTSKGQEDKTQTAS